MIYVTHRKNDIRKFHVNGGSNQVLHDDLSQGSDPGDGLDDVANHLAEGHLRGMDEIVRDRRRRPGHGADQNKIKRSDQAIDAFAQPTLGTVELVMILQFPALFSISAAISCESRGLKIMTVLMMD